MDTANELKYDQIIEALGGVVAVTQAAATAAEAAATAAAVIVNVANEQVSEVVSTYTDIPSASSPNSSLYLVLESSGGMFNNQYPAGFYRKVAGVWTFIGPQAGGAMANVIVTNSPTVQIEDTTGNALSSTSGSLNVNVTNSTPGAATADNQTTEITALTVIETNTANAVTASTNAANLLLAAQVATTSAVTETAALLLAAQTATAANQPITGTVSISNFPSVQHAILDSGTVTISNPTTSVSISNFPATQPVSISGTVPISGTVSDSNEFSTTATQTVVSAIGLASTLLLAANPNRKGVYMNPTSKVVYLNYGAAATSSPSVVVLPVITGISGGQIWNMPFPIYQGAIYGYTATTNNVTVTELT